MVSRENKKNNSKIGKIGEDIFVKHLVKHKYSILDRNFRKKWGEIDVVAKKNNLVHFFEVKTIRKDGFFDMFHMKHPDIHDPLENIHAWKRRRFAKTIESYLQERNVSHETEWQVNAGAVFLDFKNKRAKIKIIKDIDLG